MYNLNIPGWMAEDDLKVIEELASKVPQNGIIVEIGSFAGRSSYAWSKSCDPSVTVFCIDKWDSTERLSQAGSDSIKPQVPGFVPFCKKDIHCWRRTITN